jgi:hypothetical protein
MSKLLRLAIVAAILVVGLLLLWASAHRSRSQKRLQAYKAKLRAEGEKLSFRELTGSQMVPANGYVAAFTNAVAAFTQQRLYPGNVELRQYSAPGLARVSWKQDQPPWSSNSVPAARSGWEDFAAQMDGLQKQLAALRETVADPPPSSGPVTNLLFRAPISYVALRNAAHWLMGAALCDLHQGRREEAVQNIEALAMLSRLHRDEYLLVSQMIRVAIAGLGTAITWEALADNDLTDAQLERLQRAWEYPSLLEGLEKGMLGERAVGADLWASLHDPARATARAHSLNNLFSTSRNQGWETFVTEHLMLPVYRMTSIDEDELFHLQFMQQTVEAIRLFEARHPRAEARQTLNRNMATISKTFAVPAARLRYWFSAMAIPNFSRAVDTGLRNETERQLTVAAIALRRYHLRHGQWPATLADLTPEFFKEVPCDPMTGKSLCYYPVETGGFVLYSVGEDEKDNDGDPSPQTSTAKPGLWEGKDAVWPVPFN